MPFRIALSGLHAASADLKVTGNNIANSATTGFKRSRAEFVDVYAAAYGAITSVTNGNGARTSNIRQIFAQGNVEYTDNSTDLAITGQGFFMVEDDKGRYLTRNGTFGLDRDGYVVNATGQTLQVFPPASVGTSVTFNTGSLIDLQLQNTIGAPVATTEVETNVNVDADVTPIDVGATAATYWDNTTTPFDRTNPATYNHVTATTTYDSLGAPHELQMYFRKVDEYAGIPSTPQGTHSNLWQMFTFMDGIQLEPSIDGTVGGAASGTPFAVMEFNNDGTLLDTKYQDAGPAEAISTVANQIVFTDFAPPNLKTGAANMQIALDFSGTTQYGSEFAVNTINQDGFTTGRLTGFDVEENGTVFARYTNGNKEVLGMVGLANVPNPQGLRQKGDSLWVETFDAGDTVLGQPGTASLGLIQSGALEASTVELSDELVNMIVAQRSYQANAQVISTADQLTQTLLNIR
jgi:flagellar hook protein FlgE